MKTTRDSIELRSFDDPRRRRLGCQGDSAARGVEILRLTGDGEVTDRIEQDGDNELAQRWILERHGWLIGMHGFDKGMCEDSANDPLVIRPLIEFFHQLGSRDK